MKVDKIANGIIERTTPEISRTLHSGEVGKTITELRDKAGDLAGRTQVLLNSVRKEITDRELKSIKEELRQKMVQRNFSPNTIDYILSYTGKHNWEVTRAFVDDMYAHTSKIEWAVPYTTKETAPLMLDAVKKKNYEAIYDIERGKIKDFSQIKDMREDVINNGRQYIPNTTTKSLSVSSETLKAEKQKILAEFKTRGIDFTGYEYAINEESIEVAKVLSEDKNVGSDFLHWVLPYTNAENSELMLRAVLNKDYEAVYSIHSGNTRLFETLEARYAALKRMAGASKEEQKIYQEFLGTGNRKENPVINDMNSNVLKILFENPEYDLNFIQKIFKYINKNNTQELAEALRNKDFATVEKICGEKFESKHTNIFDKALQDVIDAMDAYQKRSRFVNIISKKLAQFDRNNKFDINTFKNSEVRNLAKLLGTTEEQILNMDKKEYRRLCMKWHPDRNPNDNLSAKIFEILNKIFASQK